MNASRSSPTGKKLRTARSTERVQRDAMCKLRDSWKPLLLLTSLQSSSRSQFESRRNCHQGSCLAICPVLGSLRGDKPPVMSMPSVHESASRPDTSHFALVNSFHHSSLLPPQYTGHVKRPSCVASFKDGPFPLTRPHPLDSATTYSDVLAR